MDRGAIEAGVREVGARLAAHAGGLELAGIADDGTVTVRYTGMCTGCPYRPLTTAWTVRPALLAFEGVTAVRTEGSRISEEAEARLAAALAGSPPVWAPERARRVTPVSQAE